MAYYWQSSSPSVANSLDRRYGILKPLTSLSPASKLPALQFRVFEKSTVQVVRHVLNHVCMILLLFFYISFYV